MFAFLSASAKLHYDTQQFVEKAGTTDCQLFGDPVEMRDDEGQPFWFLPKYPERVQCPRAESSSKRSLLIESTAAADRLRVQTPTGRRRGGE